MEKKKNIIFITGKDAYGVEIETERLIEAFRTRQDSQNIDSYRIEEIRDWSMIHQDMNTMSLFAEKRLFVFRGEIKTKDKEADTEKNDKKPTKKTDDILVEICENVSDDTFIIFAGVTLGAKSSLLTWLMENADTRKYDDIWNVGLWEKRYPKLTHTDIQTLISRYESSISDISDTRYISYQIAQAFEKLSLITETRYIGDADYDASMSIEGSAKMFDFSDAILRGDGARGLELFHRMIETMNIYAFIASFLGLIRTSMYVRYMKYHEKTLREISSVITAHPYVIQKAYEGRIPYEKLYKFYNKILGLNTAYRSGKGKKNPELGLIFEIELALMGLKK